MKEGFETVGKDIASSSQVVIGRTEEVRAMPGVAQVTE